MSLKSMLLTGICLAVLFAKPSSAITVSGTVKDGGGRPISGAVIRFVNELNPRTPLADSTGNDGSYRIVLSAGTVVEQSSSDPLPTAFGLFPNYPNPFNPSTLIPYQIGKTAHVRMRIYNLLGQPIRTLVDQVHLAGAATVEWDGRSDGNDGVSAGIYVVRLEAEGVQLTRKMLLLDGVGNTVFSAAPRSKNAALQAQLSALYSVWIEGDNIESFSRTQIALAADTTLHFEVVRRPLLVAAGSPIDAIVQRAQPGDIVELADGIYTGQTLRLKEGVTLRGKGSARTILSASFLSAAHLGGAAIEHLTLKNSGNNTTPAVDILAAEVSLRNCRIEENKTFCAIQIGGRDAKVFIEDSFIGDNSGIGIWAKGGAQLELARNTIERNGKEMETAAVLLTDAGTRASIFENTIKNNDAAGLAIEHSAGGQITDNEIANNALRTQSFQIDISGIGTQPLLANNSIVGRGVRIRDGATGQLLGNSIGDNTTRFALEISGAGTNPTIRANLMRGGIRIDQQATSQLIGNTITGRQNGIEISGAGTNPTIRDNTLRCESAGTVGIQVGDGAAGQIVANTIAGYGTGIQLIGRSELARDIGDNELSDNLSDIREVNPEIVWMNRFTLAMNDLKAGRFAQAAELFRRAITEAPYPVLDIQARYYLGVTLMRMGHFGEANPAFEQVLDLAPEHQEARWNLRLSHQQVGTDPDALRQEYRLDLALPIAPRRDLVRFSDVAIEAGVALINMGRGSAWRDLDGDGWLDLLAVEDGGAHALFHNQRDGTFVEIAERAGLADPRGGWSALWADYDNDGAADIFVTRDGFQGLGPNSLYRNEGSGEFVEVTQRAGLDKIADSFCAAWGDYDNDGWLDLYIGNGIARKGNANTLYRNNGDGTFADVSEQAGVDDGLRATIGATWGDYDNDGWLDLYVVNNGGACALYHNEGDGTFSDVTQQAGVIGPLFGFVAFFLDYDNDGWLDLFVSSSAQTVVEVIQSAISGKPSLFSGNRCYLYRNNRDGTFTDLTQKAGLDRTLGTMAATYGDINNDGYQDLYLANGGPAMDRFEPDLIFLNNGNGTFAEISAAAGLHIIGKGHGTTMADYDNDGDLDIYSPQGGVGGNAGQAQQNMLLRNEGTANNWLFIELIGSAKAQTSPLQLSNRDGIGAKVTVRLAEAILYAEVNGGSGFGVTNSLPLEFGLGTATRVDAVEVRWPSGFIDRFADVPINQTFVIVEGTGQQR